MKLMLILFSFFSLTTIYAQRDWSLQNCVDSMLINSPKIRLAETQFFVQEIEHQSEKWNFLPTVNANVSHGYNWGQTIDPFTNQFASSRVQYNNFSLSSSVVLFSGLRNYYSKKIAGIDFEIARINQEIEKRNAVIDVVGAYLQVLLNQKILEIRSSHLELIKKEAEKIKKLKALNYRTHSDVLQIEAQQSKDEHALILVQNDLKKSLLLLQQVIGRKTDSAFSVSRDVVLSSSINYNPNELNELHLVKQKFQLKNSNSSFFPSISLNGSLGSGYSENNKFLAPNGQFISKPFSAQLSENFYQSLSANLSIPIFSKVRNYNAPKIQQLELERIKIQNEERERIFENEKIQRKIEVINNESALKSAKKNTASFRKLFEEAKTLFEAGNINFYEFSKAKEDFFQAEAELTQIEYKLVFSRLLIEVLD